MSSTHDPIHRRPITRRNALKVAAAASAGLAFAPTLASAALNPKKEKTMSPKAFVYTEVQVSVADFNQAPWRELNPTLLAQPGLLNKTWLWGVGSGSLGGLYSFDSVANAEAFVTEYFPTEARAVGATHNTKVFDAEATREASEGTRSVHFGGARGREPGAFVYTEVQVNVPFDKAPWRDRNPVLLETPGLISKTWLSGLHTHTLGGLDAFDTVEHAKDFAINAFPNTAKKLNAAFTTRVFDAKATREASIEMKSPFYV